MGDDRSDEDMFQAVNEEAVFADERQDDTVSTTSADGGGSVSSTIFFSNLLLLREVINACLALAAGSEGVATQYIAIVLPFDCNMPMDNFQWRARADPHVKDTS